MPNGSIGGLNISTVFRFPTVSPLRGPGVTAAGALGRFPSVVPFGTLRWRRPSPAVGADSSAYMAAARELLEGYGATGTKLEQYMDYAGRIWRLIVGGAPVNYLLDAGESEGLSRWVLNKLVNLAREIRWR